MPLLRGRRDEASMTKYRMQEKLAIGDDFWIENEAGQQAFKVNEGIAGTRHAGARDAQR